MTAGAFLTALLSNCASDDRIELKNSADQIYNWIEQYCDRHTCDRAHPQTATVFLPHVSREMTASINPDDVVAVFNNRYVQDGITLKNPGFEFFVETSNGKNVERVQFVADVTFAKPFPPKDPRNKIPKPGYQNA